MMAPPARGSVQSRFDRWALPVVLGLLLATIATIAGAFVQDQGTIRAYERRDAAAADRMARSVSSYLRRRVSDQADDVSRYTDLLRSEGPSDLGREISAHYAEGAPDYVRAVVLTDYDGSIITAADIHGETLDDDARNVIEAAARSAIGTDTPVISGRVDIVDGSPGFALATSLTGLDTEYGAWVTVYDVELSALGAFVDDSERRPGIASPTVIDDRGSVIAGPPLPERTEGRAPIREQVTETTWRVVVPRTVPPSGMPMWVMLLLLIGIVLLGAIYWLQEGTRRALRDDALDSHNDVERLYEFAAQMLHGRSVREHAEHLARAVAQRPGVAGARVRVARERDQAGIMSGEAHADAHQYRLAITGPREPLGELIAYLPQARPTVEEQHGIQTLTAMAGAAMNTMHVLERERAAARELQRLDELRTNLMSTVAHELRSPLTAVKGVLGLLSMSDDLSDKHREYVDVAAERTDSLVALIGDLFDVSLIESGQLKIRPQRRRADELLQAALGAMATSRPDELFLSATPNLNITVDPLRFDQVLNNLVTNAFRHGKAPVDVSIRPYADGAALIVSDSGPGIPPEERDQVFAKFYQSDSGNARLVEGAGLGLSLVNGLVRLHGGRIEIDSTRVDGHGARFTIFFPDIAADADFDIATGGAEPEDELDLLREII